MALAFETNLYAQALSVVTSNFKMYKNEVKMLPVNVTLDLYCNLYREGQLCDLSYELADLDTFSRVLRQCETKRCIMYQCFQASMDHGSKVSQTLSKMYIQRASTKFQTNKNEVTHWIAVGIELGTFFTECGWFVESEQVLLAAVELVKCRQEDYYKLLSLDIYSKLLNAYNCFCKFSEGNDLFKLMQDRMNEWDETHKMPIINRAQVYTEFSSLYFWQSKYDEAYNWSVRALGELDQKTPSLTRIDVLRQAAKACVVKRSFKRAELLIKQALVITNLKVVPLSENLEDLPHLHPKIADLFADLGFYLLNVDLILQSVKFYNLALRVRHKMFTGSDNPEKKTCNNLLIAMAYEDLAYSTYVYEYSSGRFEGARILAENAMVVMQKILPKQHLLLASAKRIKALILEEIAIDHHDKVVELQMLMESQKLHLSALELAKAAFGEMNVQTAKHYGNLGRLYQSMHRYTEAEDMHLRAIQIKETLLGRDDFEVALSLGHLASLYNYDMLLFDKAEDLYLRSVKIGVKLFGEAYSGLEYDYRGLLRVYLNLSNQSKTEEYMSIMSRWKFLRDGLNRDIKEICFLHSVYTCEASEPRTLLNLFESISDS